MIQAAEELAESVGVSDACRVLGVPRSSLYRARRPKLPPAPRPSPRQALSREEKETTHQVLNSERFWDCSPRQVYATLLDEGIYLCHWRTMYRILDEDKEVRERRNQLQHPPCIKPELLATGPNQLWSWDITKSLSENSGGSKCNPGTSEMKHCQIVLDLLLPANEKATKAIQPGVGSLHHPPPCPVPRDTRLVSGFFSTGTDMCSVTPARQQLTDDIVVIPFVQAHVLRGILARARPLDYDRFQCRLHHLHVVPVRSLNGHGQGNAVTLGQQTTLCAPLAPIRGIATRAFSPPRAPSSSPHPSLATPSRALSTCRIPSPLLATDAQTHPLCATLESGRARCWPLPDHAVMLSIGNRSAVHRRSHPSLGDWACGADHPSAWGVPVATVARFEPTAHLEYATRRLLLVEPSPTSSLSDRFMPLYTKMRFSDRL